MSESILRVLSLPAVLANGPGVLSPVIVYDEEHTVLIDAGLPQMAEAIAEAMAEAGAPLARLTHIAITHTDMDHIGSIAALQRMAAQPVEVVCHEAERVYVECDAPPIRLSQMEAGLAGTPEEHRPRMQALVESLRANYTRFKARVDRTVTDGDSLPCGMEVIYTPGHTPGHLCYYHRPSRTLVAGDMFNVEGGQLVSAPAFTMLDREAYRQSVKKLLAYPIETAVCYHGGLFQGDVGAVLAGLLGV